MKSADVEFDSSESLTHLERLKYVDVDEVFPSETNPRKTFNATDMRDLEANVRVNGILQPILVRPFPPGEDGTTLPGYQLVAGERRLRAAKAAGLKRIPANIRELSDAEAMEIQVIENLQRSEIHPLEEADGYKALIETHNYSVEDLAKKVGKSRAYIYGRLKFVELPKPMREALRKDEVSPSVALLVARIPDEKLRKKASEEILGHYSGPMTYRDALDHIKGHYMLRMEDAPFDVKDEMLCPEAGSCIVCPKRTGRDKELFNDIQKDDLCTDPVCYEDKTRTSERLKLENFKQMGCQILERPKSEKLFKWGRLSSDKYLRLDGNLPGSDKPLKDALPAIPPEHILVVIDPESGLPCELILKQTVENLIPAASDKSSKKQVEGLKLLVKKPEDIKSQQVSPEKIEKSKALAKALVLMIRDDFAKRTHPFVSAGGWKYLFSGLLRALNSDFYRLDYWFSARGLKFTHNTKDIYKRISEHLNKQDNFGKAAMFAEISLLLDFWDEDEIIDRSTGAVHENLRLLAKAHGIDVKDVSKKLAERLEDKPAENAQKPKVKKASKKKNGSKK